MEIDLATLRGFRGHRLGLLSPAADLVEAARIQVGGQAQVEKPVLLGLSLRTEGRPKESVVRDALHSGRVVRAWGQRDTVQAYPPELWPWVVAARPQWGKSGRGQDPHAEARIEAAVEVLDQQTEPCGRDAFEHLVDATWLEAIDDKWFPTYAKKWRYAAGRLIWGLGNRGLLAHGPKRGSEQLYVPRRLGWPELDFSAEHADPEQAARKLAERYLASYGPATVQDLAHFFGAKVSSARTWVAGMPDLVTVRCEGRELLCRSADLDAVENTSPARGVRLLPAYDNLLMGHADKSVLVPNEADRKQIWKKAAVVMAVVWHDGVAVATWKPTLRAKRVHLEITPLSGWTNPDLIDEANALGRYYDRPEVEVSFTGS